MPITFSYRIAAVAAGMAIAASAQLIAPGAGALPGAAAVPQAAASAAARDATVRYWTAGRMTAALRASGGQPAGPTLRHLVKQAPPVKRKPAPLSGDTNGQGRRWTHGGPVTDAVGKVFFTLGGTDYVCSGTLIGPKGLVLTAAHCVSGGPGRKGMNEWATNWMFAPGYRNGQLPYGEYTARKFFVMPGWAGPEGGTEEYDVAFAQVVRGTLYGKSRTPTTPPGLPAKFAGRQDAVPASRAYVFGYPSLPPYDGKYPNYCAGPASASHGSLQTSCGMTAGDSGGPWLAGLNAPSGRGQVVAVSTYKVSSNLSVLYGAVLGPRARALYGQAVSPGR